MDFAILSSDGLLFLLRWLHFFFGVIWIGLLYYFNFVQGAFFTEIDAGTKSVAIQKLVPRALWWFRWGAMGTWLTGLFILGMRGHGPAGIELFYTSWGVCILTGMVLGTVMWANVWFVIWPNQKIVIQSATDAAQGKPANPAAAGAGAKAGLASRHNVLFSIPMLFFMGAASHLPINITPETSLTTYWVVALTLTAGLEFNALKGKTGPLTTVKGVVHCGFALAVVWYVLLEVLT